MSSFFMMLSLICLIAAIGFGGYIVYLSRNPKGAYNR